MCEKSHKSIVVLGCKFSGKTTHGRILANHYGYKFFDIDEILKSMTGHTYRELLAVKQLQDLYQLEEEACQKVFEESKGEPFVFAASPNTCDNVPAVSVLRQAGTFVFLEFDLDLSVKRVLSKISQNENGDFINLPTYVKKLNPKSMEEIRSIVEKMYNDRYQSYRTISDVTVVIKNVSIEENAEYIRSKL